MNFTPIRNLCLFMVVLSSMMAISSSNWLCIWLSLEINMFTFIPVILSSNINLEMEAAIKYFINQSFASSMMLVFILLYYSNLMNMSWTFYYMVLFSFLLKLGSFPGYFWFPSVMKSMNWLMCLILSTWQKLAPLFIIIFYLSCSSLIMMIISVSNMFIGGCFGFNQSNIRVIMAYSSISHMGWMMSLLIFNYKLMTMGYFFLYSLLNIPIFMILLKLNMVSLSKIKNLSKSNYSLYLSFHLLLLSLSGLPPLTGFFPKLMVLNLVSNYSKILTLFMIFLSLLSLYFYLMLSFSMIFELMKNFCMKKLDYNLFYTLLVSFFPLPLLIFIYAMILLN